MHMSRQMRLQSEKRTRGGMRVPSSSRPTTGVVGLRDGDSGPNVTHSKGNNRNRTPSCVKGFALCCLCVLGGRNSTLVWLVGAMVTYIADLCGLQTTTLLSALGTVSETAWLGGWCIELKKGLLFWLKLDVVKCTYTASLTPWAFRGGCWDFTAGTLPSRCHSYATYFAPTYPPASHWKRKKLVHIFGTGFILLFFRSFIMYTHERGGCQCWYVVWYLHPFRRVIIRWKKNAMRQVSVCTRDDVPFRDYILTLYVYTPCRGGSETLQACFQWSSFLL